MKLFLAPVQGMTTAVYRNAFARIFGGIDSYYAPFIAAADMRKVNRQLLKDLLPRRNDARVRLVPQLLANDGAEFKLFAAAIVDMGYGEINWNIGCPFPMVTKKKKGSGILTYPDMVRKFLDAACADSSYTLSVKMRLGLEDPEDGMQVIRVLNDYPLGSVIIHARTGIQMYGGNADLDSFEALASACSHEVTYNGDIFTYDDYTRISSRFPHIKNHMLGRGALRDPFLPSAIKGINIPYADKIGMIRDLHDEIFNYCKSTLSGDRHLLDKMKEFWVYMSVHTDHDGKLIKRIKKCRSSAEYLEAVNHTLNTVSAWNDSPILFSSSPPPGW